VLRFRLAAGAAARLVQEGAIGAIRTVRVQYVHAGSMVPEKTWLQNPGEGPGLLDWGCHCADLLRWSLQSEPERVYATYPNYAAPGWKDDSAMVQYEFANGSVAQIWSSDDLPKPGLEPTDVYLFVGSTGMIELETFGRVRLSQGGE